MMINQITNIEKVLKTFEKSWKKEIKTTNAEILGGTPMTRSNDARIKKMIANTESIFKKYATDLIEKLNQLDVMGQEYRSGVVEDEVLILIVNTMQNAVDALKMEQTLEFPKQTQTVMYTAPKEVTDLLTRWKRIRSTLPSVKIGKIEEPLMQKQSELDLLLATRGELEAESAALTTKIAELNDDLIAKKVATENALVIEEEAKKKLAEVTTAMNAKIAEYDSEIRNLQNEIHSVGLEQSKRDLAQAMEMCDKNIVASENRIEELNTQLQQQKTEEELARKKSEKAVLFKNKKLALASELSAKVVATQAELEAETVKLNGYKSYKEQTYKTLNAKIADIQNKLNNLNSQITAISNNKKAAEDNITREERAYNEKAEQKRRADKDYETPSKNLESLERKLKKVNKSISDTEKQIQTLSSEIDGYNQEINKIKASAALAREKAEKRIQNEVGEITVTVNPETSINVSKKSNDNEKSISSVSRGRPSFDKLAIIDELKRRYPNGSEYTSADDLFAANPDLLPRLKTLKNNANELFGMPLGKYLLQEGIITKKPVVDRASVQKAKRLDMKMDKEKAHSEQMQLILDYLVDKYKDDRAESLKDIEMDNPDIDFYSLRTYVKKTYQKTLNDYLSSIHVIKTLAEIRHEKRSNLLKEFRDTYKDIPLEIEKYIREIQLDDPPISTFVHRFAHTYRTHRYRRFFIDKGYIKPEYYDFIEYSLCRIEGDEEKYYSTEGYDIAVGDMVLIDRGIISAKRVISVEKMFGMDSPTSPEYFGRIIGKADDINISKLAKYNLSFVPDKNTFDDFKEVFYTETFKFVPMLKEAVPFFMSEESYNERGFINAVFRGPMSEIQKAQDLVDIGLLINKTEISGIFEFVIENDRENLYVRKILQFIPSLKMISFFAVWNGLVDAVYSESGYSYITDVDFPSYLYSKEDEEPWMYNHLPTESHFRENTDHYGEWVLVNYHFVQEKKWDSVDYVIEENGQYYKVTAPKVTARKPIIQKTTPAALENFVPDKNRSEKMYIEKHTLFVNFENCDEYTVWGATIFEPIDAYSPINIFEGMEDDPYNTIYIGKDVKTITQAVFTNIDEHNKEVVRIIVDVQNSVFASKDGKLYSKDFKTLYTIPSKQISSVTEISDVENIGYDVIVGSDEVETIIIHEGIKSISGGAIWEVYNLKKIYLPDSLKIIEEGTLIGHRDDVTIYAHKDSFAIEYAKLNNFNFVELDKSIKFNILES